MKTQSGSDKGKYSACHKWQRTGQSNRSTLLALTPDFRVSVASMNPIACEEPVSERRDDTSAHNDRNKSRPVHSVLPAKRWHSTRTKPSTLSISIGVTSPFHSSTPSPGHGSRQKGEQTAQACVMA